PHVTQQDRRQRAFPARIFDHTIRVSWRPLRPRRLCPHVQWSEAGKGTQAEITSTPCARCAIWFAISLSQKRIRTAMSDTPAQPLALPRVAPPLLMFPQPGAFTLPARAFAPQCPALVVAAAVILALSAAFPPLGPFRLIYRFLLVPIHILRPRVVEDDPAPH